MSEATFPLSSIPLDATPDATWCTCGTCGRAFPDLYPSGRCPFEADHDDPPRATVPRLTDATTARGWFERSAGHAADLIIRTTDESGEPIVVVRPRGVIVADGGRVGVANALTGWDFTADRLVASYRNRFTLVAWYGDDMVVVTIVD